MNFFRTWPARAIALAILVFPLAAPGVPYTPDSDAAVLERLPERTDPSIKQLRAASSALARNKNDVDLATNVARKAISLSREYGDPRFLGQAQGALTPWWSMAKPPPPVLLLRATIRQSAHEFDAALVDLDALLHDFPADAQARLTRATVRAVRGRYAESLDDCAMLARRVSTLIVAACGATPLSSSGHDEAAYASLLKALQSSGDAPEIRAWALTMAGEISARRGDAAAARVHFRDAMQLDPRDAYLRAAFADLLLDTGEPAAALALVEDETRNDVLLLRVVLAEQRLPDRSDAFKTHRDALSARFDAARRRGDSLHRREEARFRLAILGDSSGALDLARENWKVQREPADMRILVEAAKQAEDTPTLTELESWKAAVRKELAGESLSGNGR